MIRKTHKDSTQLPRSPVTVSDERRRNRSTTDEVPEKKKKDDTNLSARLSNTSDECAVEEKAASFV